MIPGNFDEGWSAGDLEPRGPPWSAAGGLTAPSGLRPVREPLLVGTPDLRQDVRNAPAFMSNCHLSCSK
jgi:hypothetical protein